MNFGNPYYYVFPTNLGTQKVGLLTRLFGSAGSSIGSFINGTQKVLNIANQTIPLVKQIRPMVGNAKTMFRVMNEFKKANNPIQSHEIIKEENIKNVETLENNEGPKFFI